MELIEGDILLIANRDRIGRDPMKHKLKGNTECLSYLIY